MYFRGKRKNKKGEFSKEKKDKEVELLKEKKDREGVLYLMQLIKKY